MLSGSFEYDSEVSLKVFKAFVEKHYPIKTDLIIYSSEDDDPSLAALDDADALLIFTRRLNTEGVHPSSDFKTIVNKADRLSVSGQPATRIKIGLHLTQMFSGVTTKGITVTDR